MMTHKKFPCLSGFCFVVLCSLDDLGRDAFPSSLICCQMNILSSRILRSHEKLMRNA